ncbi:MAG: hypothetical protein ACPGFA_13930 [Pikeienuella sp.]
MLQQTFMSVWYWGLSALLWAMICNWTFGVPNELLIRAGKGGEDAALFDRFARRNIAMISAAIDRQGVFVGGFVAFVVAIIATVAVRDNSEPAQGALFVIGPMVLMSAHSGLRLHRLAANPPGPARLRAVFLSERRRSVFAAAFFMFLAFGYARALHGPGWFGRMISGL